MKRVNKNIYFIVGDNGSGKNEVANILATSIPNLKILISHTTRNKREEERNGKDYYFVNKEEFEKLIPNFMEYTIYDKKSYGHSKLELLDNIKNNNHLVFIIEPNGILNILKWLKESYEGNIVTNEYNLVFNILYIRTKKSIRLKRLLKNLLNTTDSYEEDFEKTDLVIKRLQRENNIISTYIEKLYISYQKYFDVKISNIDNDGSVMTLKTKYLSNIIEKAIELNYNNSLKI